MEPYISIVIPVYNEEENVKILFKELRSVLKKDFDGRFELIFVNDGSTDKTKYILEDMQSSYNYVLLANHKKSKGKAFALDTGFSMVSGDLVVTMDGDLQDSPEGITSLVRFLEKGSDAVFGWRKNRMDSKFKTLSSKLMNLAIFHLSGLKIHDFYCGLKGYHRKVLEDMAPKGELCRFTPLLAHKHRLKFAEVAVPHNSRRFGKSSYSVLGRVKRSLKDFKIVITVLFFS